MCAQAQRSLTTGLVVDVAMQRDRKRLSRVIVRMLDLSISEVRARVGVAMCVRVRACACVRARVEISMLLTPSLCV